MNSAQDHRIQARETWAAGDWDGVFSKLITPVGALILDRAELATTRTLLDVGTGSGANVAIPAARRGVSVTGLDPTPELLDHARRRAAEAGVEIEWVEGDAQELPFADRSFDVVTSTFGAMFAPDHARAAAELVRVCASPGRVLMTTWLNDGFAGELFDLMGSFLPAPAAGGQPASLWGSEPHVVEVFEASGVTPSIDHSSVEFSFVSVEEMVSRYAEGFGPFVAARAVLEPEGRWTELLDAYADLIRRFNLATDGSARIRSEYLIITVDR